MSTSSIAKLLPPSLSRVVSRPRVAARIADNLAASSCWLSAPAGYGKTTAVVDYLSGHAGRVVWYRIDEGDQDVASFFHDLSLALGDPAAALPLFGPEYAEQTQAFARRFFRTWFAALPAGAILVLDDLQDADGEPFRNILSVLFQELPDQISCICLSRTLPPAELQALLLAGRLRVLGQDVLQFSEPEARALIEDRQPGQGAALPIERARGWAAGLMLLAEPGIAATLALEGGDLEMRGESALFDVLGRQMFEGLPSGEQDMLLKLSLFSEITPRLAAAMVGSHDASQVLDRLYRRQLLVSRGERSEPGAFRLHDLLRDFLNRRLVSLMSLEDQARLRETAALALEQSGAPDEAIDLALLGGAWALARRLILRRAEDLLAHGRRATLIDWCARFPAAEQDAWLCYWRGVAHVPDDLEAEAWLAKAWSLFESAGNLEGQHLSVARAVLVKTDSWRTHTGLSLWTHRALALLGQPTPALRPNDELLVLMGLLRALDFADDYRDAAPKASALAHRLLARLNAPKQEDQVNLRLLASATILEHAGSMGQAELFEQAVDMVARDLRHTAISPWVLGLWLVAFGSVSGRYFPYSRRGFPYADAEAALRAAIAIGETESLPAVEFGALYHLQYQMKLANNRGELATLIGRLGEVADSRHTTQVAVLADCQAALHTMRGDTGQALAACARFMAAIEAADEPPIERWPHFVTQFQAMLAARTAAQAAAYLASLTPLFEGAVAERTWACIRAAEAFDAKWGGADDYPERLEVAIQALASAGWSAILANLPDLLAELLADALDRGIEVEFCRRLIAQRRLSPPQRRPQSWPWALKIHVLGEFRLERDAEPLNFGAKPAARSLDLLRVLAVVKDHTCALAALHDGFWPDADGDMAKAACEQALHRLRKLLGRADLVVQREGKLKLAMDQVWIDIDDWEQAVHEAAAEIIQLEALFLAFPGPLLIHERENPWSATAAERVRSKLLEIARGLGDHYERQGAGDQARRIHLRSLDFYPQAARVHEALISGSLARDDMVSAWEDYERFQRSRSGEGDDEISPALQARLQRGVKPSAEGRTIGSL